MIKDDIISIAREAGFEQLGPDIEDWVCFTDELVRFAELLEAKIRAEEREACAKVIEDDCHDDMTRAEEAAAIRARGEK